MTHLRIALLLDDEVIAVTDDPGSVRVAAGMMASAPLRAEDPAVKQPIEVGRRQSCHMIAMGAA
jgi:hypothetical protein